jgi:hypothetical protein
LRVLPTLPKLSLSPSRVRREPVVAAAIAVGAAIVARVTVRWL